MRCLLTECLQRSDPQSRHWRNPSRKADWPGRKDQWICEGKAQVLFDPRCEVPQPIYESSQLVQPYLPHTFADYPELQTFHMSHERGTPK